MKSDEDTLGLVARHGSKTSMAYHSTRTSRFATSEAGEMSKREGRLMMQAISHMTTQTEPMQGFVSKEYGAPATPSKHYVSGIGFVRPTVTGLHHRDLSHDGSDNSPRVTSVRPNRDSTGACVTHCSYLMDGRNVTMNGLIFDRPPRRLR